MIDKKWFKENMTFCTYDEYEKGKQRYIERCIKEQRRENIEEFKQELKKQELKEGLKQIKHGFKSVIGKFQTLFRVRKQRNY